LNEREILDLLLHGNQLKRTIRTGWGQRGVVASESVAAHSYGVAYVALVLLGVVAEPVDAGRALALAVLHDLPEALTSDIPSPAWRFLPGDSKQLMEKAALTEIVDATPLAPVWQQWWDELVANESAAARLAHDADKIDLYLQAIMYEEQTGNRHLDEFWRNDPDFHFGESRAIFEALRARRAKGNGEAS
jgi:putative hydrolase of HD superfamily